MAEESDRTGLDRLMLFSDGVFAIAITLLVLPLTDAQIPPGRVGETLHEIMPLLLTFALSFAVIGRFWMVHHLVFRRIVRADTGLLALNLLYLFFVALLPFPTSVLGEHSGTTAAVVLYALNLIAVGLASTVLWVYAARGHRLIDPHVGHRTIRSSLAGGLAPVLGLLPSIPLAFVDTAWAKLSWLLMLPAAALADRLFPPDD